MPTQWNQELSSSRNVFSKVIECLEQSIRKQIDCKRLSNELIAKKSVLKYTNRNIAK